jgi:hypothetical protein
MSLRFLYTQIGRRENYAPACALHATGALSGLSVDLWNRRPVLRKLLEWLPVAGPLKPFARYYRPELDRVPINHFPAGGFEVAPGHAQESNKAGAVQAERPLRQDLLRSGEQA